MNEVSVSEQLPKADRNSELEQLSINAFNSALPVEKFVFREEGRKDAGVDGTLELKINSRYSGLRAQVQLKSTGSEATNKDGSFSVQVSVANFNYLLNSSSPIYVLFVYPRNELRFAWARDERTRFDANNPDWKQQKHITIRFNNVLDAIAIEQIHERIQKEARVQGKISDILSLAGNAESVVVSINRESLSITDAAEAEHILLSSGTLIVTAGYPEQVRHMARLLDHKSAQNPRILLVRAFAEYVLARYQSAYALLSESMLYQSRLSADDRQFVSFLRDGCDYQFGKLTMQELAARLNGQAQPPSGGFSGSYLIEQIRIKFLSNPDPLSQNEAVEELRVLVAKILKDANTSDVFKVYARSRLLEAEGFNINRTALLEIGDARLKLQTGGVLNIPELLREHTKRFQIWEQEIASLNNDAMNVGHPNLIAEISLQRAVAYFQFLTNQRAFSLLFNVQVTFSDDAIKKYIDVLAEVGEVYSQANQLEGKLRAELLRADFLELIGQEDEAREIARNVLPKAQAMDYTIIISRAQEHLLGQGFRSKQDSVSTEKTEEQKVRRNAIRSDEESRAYAAQALRAMELDAERLPVLEREYFSLRDVAREKLNWCRYIDRLNDERHTWHPSTKYRTDPDRICICQLHGFRSPIPNPDWNGLGVTFKKTYCEKCPDRNPFEP